MLQSDIITIIEKTAPLSLMAEWDRSGVQVASPRKEIRHLAVCLDPAPEQIAAAVENGADMVLTHHPLAMRPEWTNRLNGYTDVLRTLYSRDVPLYSCHTSLDANPLGPSAWLPDELGLAERVILEKTGSFTAPGGTEAEGGFGLAGTLPEPMTLAELCRRIRAFLPLDRMCGVARLIGDPERVIRRVAVCTGSGSSLLEDAARAFAEAQGEARVGDGAPAGEGRGQGLAVEVAEGVGGGEVHALKEGEPRCHGQGVGGHEPALDHLAEKEPRPEDA